MTTALTVYANAQSGYVYYCQEVVYGYSFVNKKDGGSLTFYNNGRVAINGKIDKRFSYDFYDCTIILYYNGKKINVLEYSIYSKPIGEHIEYFIDNRGIKYYTVKRIK